MFEPTFYEAEGRAVKMAWRVGGGTRRATFEKQFEFFRKETADREVTEVRSPRGRARRAH